MEEVSSTVLRVTKYDEEDPSDSESASQKDLESEEPATPTCTQVSEESVVGGAADEEATHVMTLVPHEEAEPADHVMTLDHPGMNVESRPGSSEVCTPHPQLEEVSSTVLRVTEYDEEDQKGSGKDPINSESASQKDLESEETATPTCTQVSEESVVLRWSGR